MACSSSLTDNGTSCSEHGFCGTTADFCNAACQSNCVEHPSPPPGSPKGQVLSRVIGYYEAWNANSACRQTLPSDLPRLSPLSPPPLPQHL